MTNYTQTNFTTDQLPNIMERDYGNGVVLTQQSDDNGSVIPFSVYNFGTSDWSWDMDRVSEVSYNTLSEAEEAIASM